MTRLSGAITAVDIRPEEDDQAEAVVIRVGVPPTPERPQLREVSLRLMDGYVAVETASVMSERFMARWGGGYAGRRKFLAALCR